MNAGSRNFSVMSARAASRERPKPSVLRVLAAVAAALVASVVIAGAPTSALANPNPAITVGNVTVESGDGEQATVGDILTVSGTWDASESNPQPGDTFVIGLPSVLGFPQAVPFTLDGPTPLGDVVTWATCLTDPATGLATCTLTEEVLAFPESVLGEFELMVEAVEATTAESVVFNLNGVDVSVDLPGTGGIDDGVTVPTTWDKSGEMNADKWSMSWTINLPGSRLAGEDVVTILEELSDNHELCTPSGLKIETVRGSAVVDVTSIGATSTDVSAPYDFSIVLTAPVNGFDPTVTYRISYDTCTPDGQIDPIGTVYENTAAIDVWGESSGVIGVEQDWEFNEQLSKQGSVLGGSDRNGQIRWTITVAGDHLAGKNSFTLSEALTGQHEVCADTISGIRVFERYGPSTVQQREITAELAVTTVSSSASAFEVVFTIEDGSDLVLQPSDFMYVIQYDTCATTDGLPESGTTFGNTASIDGAVDGSSATVPGRTDQKRGSINSGSVTLDGVQYLPQTTLNWTITVPGQKLTEVASDLVVTDVLSGGHEVCVGSGGTLASRLGLTIEARDQIQNGGLATVNLTSSAEATLSGSTITISIPQPTLAQPGGGVASGFSHEYQYVISYTTCTTSGGMDAPGTTYSNSAEVAGFMYGHSTTQSNSGSGTGQGVARGSIALSKGLAITAGAEFVPADATFTVHVKEIDPTGVVQVEYDLVVPVDGSLVSGPNSRGTGWTAELSEPTFPSIPGVTFSAPVFAPGPGVTVSPDGTTAIVALTPGSNIPVSLTNTAELGSLAVAKLVEGPAADLVDADREYTITASIDVSALGAGFPAQADRVFTISSSNSHLLEGLPIGAVVTFSETLPADDDILTWSPAAITPGSIEVLPVHATDPATISVVNSVARTVGTFSIVKTVTGDQADNAEVPDSVTVTATWAVGGVPQQKVLTVPTDGTPVPFGENLLIGAAVTLTETPLVDGSSIAWAAPVWSGTGVSVAGDSAVVTIGRDADATASLQNHAATSTAGIRLLKGLAGAAAGEVDAETEFPVTASWMDAEGDEQSVELTINAVEPTPIGVDLPAGTIITLTEGDRPEFDTVVWGDIVMSGNGVDDAGDGSATVVVSDQQSDVTLVSVVNEANWAPGTFSLSKTVAGILLDDAEVPESVTVVARWLGEGDVERSAEIEVPTDGTVVPFGEDLPHGTAVELSELEATDSERFTWNTPTWGGDVDDNGDGTATVTVEAATVAGVSLTNSVTATVGSVQLVKTLTGVGASGIPSGATFPVTLTWTDLLGETQVLDTEVRAGTPTVIDGVPIGTEVRIQEHAGSLPEQIRWDGVEWSSGDSNVAFVSDDDGTGARIEITAGSGATVSMSMVNEFSMAPALAFTGMGGALGLAAGLGALLIALGTVLAVRRNRAA